MKLVLISLRRIYNLSLSLSSLSFSPPLLSYLASTSLSSLRSVLLFLPLISLIFPSCPLSKSRLLDPPQALLTLLMLTGGDLFVHHYPGLKQD